MLLNWMGTNARLVGMCWLGFSLLGSAAVAEPLQFNVVNLSAEALRELSNDQGRAQLYVEYSDSSPAKLADKLNRALADGLAASKGHPTVRSAVAGNSVYPLYGRTNKAEGWRGRAELRLESTDLPALAALIGKLQGQMQLGGMSFGLAPATRERGETELIDEAIRAFKARAEVVQRSLGGSRYRLVNISVNTQGGGGYQPAPKMAMLRAASADSELAPPPMEGGQTALTVNVSGSVQIE